MFDAQLGTELQLLQTYRDFCGITRLLRLSLLATDDLLNVKQFFFNYVEQCKIPVSLDTAINRGLLLTLLTIACL